MTFDYSANWDSVDGKGQGSNYGSLWQAIIQRALIGLNAVDANTRGSPSINMT